MIKVDIINKKLCLKHDIVLNDKKFNKGTEFFIKSSVQGTVKCVSQDGSIVLLDKSDFTSFKLTKILVFKVISTILIILVVVLNLIS